jgi:hypothetical protein
LPLSARRVAATTLLTGVVAVIALAAALIIGSGGYKVTVASFCLFGPVFGAAPPFARS